MENQNDKNTNISRENVDTFLELNQNKSVLRFITCGSVDDGKSTLIGRLLFETKTIFRDQLSQLKADSNRFGTQADKIDFALLLDGLSAEREQGITIDLSYRFFTTEKRKFIVADSPGHEQYTRNMVTGASTADIAIILVDVLKGVVTQTRRHSFICHLMGVKHIILAVNKMDLVDYSELRFKEIEKQFEKVSLEVGIKNYTSIPLSALEGENVTKSSEKLKWFDGGNLLFLLENLEIKTDKQVLEPFSMPVQIVNRYSSNFRGFSGRISTGNIKIGSKIEVFPSGKTTTIQDILTFDGSLETAVAGQSITLVLMDEIDCSRGQVIADVGSLEVADQFQVKLIWLDENALLPGRAYFLKIGTQTVTATISIPKYKINVNSMEKLAAKTLELNEIGVVNVTTDRVIPFSSYVENTSMGSFILIDKDTNQTAGACLIDFALNRAKNLSSFEVSITKDERSGIKKQTPVLLWMTGLSGAGKSTIANALEQKLFEMGRHTFLLDGDNVRKGLTKDLGFTAVDRIENIRRVAEVSKLMVEAGLIVIASFISPFKAERKMVREIFPKDEFIEIFVDAQLSVVEQRDVKGLYAKARAGKIKNFTGIDSPYEAPESAEIHINTDKMSVDDAVEKILTFLTKRYF